MKGAGERLPVLVGKDLFDFLQWPAAPRFTPALLELAARPVAQKEEVFIPLCRLLLSMRDPRALEPLRALHAGLAPGSPYARWLGITLERVSLRKVRALRAKASALCHELEEAIDRRIQGEALRAPLRDELLARVAAAPEPQPERTGGVRRGRAHDVERGWLPLLDASRRQANAFMIFFHLDLIH